MAASPMRAARFFFDSNCNGVFRAFAHGIAAQPAPIPESASTTPCHGRRHSTAMGMEDDLPLDSPQSIALFSKRYRTMEIEIKELNRKLDHDKAELNRDSRRSALSGQNRAQRSARVSARCSSFIIPFTYSQV